MPIKIVCFVWVYLYQMLLPRGLCVLCIIVVSFIWEQFYQMWLPQDIFCCQSNLWMSSRLISTRYGCPRAFCAAYKSCVHHVGIFLRDVAAPGLSLLPNKLVCSIWVYLYLMWLLQGFLCCLSKLCASSVCTPTRCGFLRPFCAAHQSSVPHLGILLPDVAAPAVSLLPMKVVCSIWVYFYLMWLPQRFLCCLSKLCAPLGPLLPDVASQVWRRAYLLPRLCYTGPLPREWNLLPLRWFMTPKCRFNSHVVDPVLSGL
jgi:hypothetical protein